MYNDNFSDIPGNAKQKKMKIYSSLNPCGDAPGKGTEKSVFLSQKWGQAWGCDTFYRSSLLDSLAKTVSFRLLDVEGYLPLFL